MVESGRVPGKGRTPASIEKLPRQVPEKGRIYVSTEKWYNTGEHRKKVKSERVFKTVSANTGKGSNLCEYQKMIESGRVPRKCTIGVSIEILLRRVPEKARICKSTEKW